MASCPPCSTRLRQLEEELELDDIVVEPNPGSVIPPAPETRSLCILTQEALPAIA